VSWQYSDIDGLAQYSYRILVFKQSVATTGGFTLNPPPAGVTTTGAVNTAAYGGTAKSFWPVYDSGDVVSSASSVQINPSVNPQFGPGPLFYPQTGGPLQSGTTYRAFVFITAVDENGAYQTITNAGTVTGNTGAVNAGMDFVPSVEPALMPSLMFPSTPNSFVGSFSGTTAAVGQIAVRARVNLLAAADADFLSPGSASTRSVGGWALDANQASTGTGTVPAISTDVPNNGLSPSALTVTPYATSTTQINVISTTGAGAAACTAGELLTGTVKIRDLRAFGALATTATAYLTFWNAAGAVVATVIPQQFVSVAVNASTVALPTLLWVQTKAPVGAVGVSIGVMIKCTVGAIAQAANWEISQAAVTANCLNILDDAGIESGLESVVAFGGTTFTGGAMANSGWVIEGATPYSAIANVAVQDIGPSWPGGQWSLPLPTNVANKMGAHTDYTIGSFASDAHAWLAACDARTVASNSPASITPGNVAASLGNMTFDGTVSAQNGVGITITPTYQRFTGFLVPAGTTPGTFGLQFAATPGAANEGVDCTNFQLERLWAFQDFNFETFTSGTNLPLATALGNYNGNTAAQPGHWWTNVSNGPGVTAAISNVTPHGGTNCLQITTAGPTVGVVEQFCTVSGASSVTFSWWWKWTALQSVAGYVEFFDSAGTLLSIGSTPGTVTSQAALVTGTGTQAAYAQATPAAINVPATAAYCHIVFTVTATLGTSTTVSIDDIGFTVVQPSGSYIASTPWLDGGWSQGGLAPTETVTLQGSPDNVNWTTKRVPPNAAAAATVVGPSFEQDYTDYEYPAGTFGVGATIYYRAFTGSGAMQSPNNLISLVGASGFSPTNWMLIDPLNGGNIALQVKGDVEFKTDENQTVLMPMGRGRKVVLGDSAIFGDTITINLQTLTNADFNALQAMYAKVYALVLRSPDGEMWYVRATTRSRKRTWQGSYARPLRTYQLVFETVDVIP